MPNGVIEGFRLSPQQERVWLLHQEQGGPAYRAQCAARIEGELNVGTLRKALDRVVKRNEILRTTFQKLPEMTIPVQVVTDAVGASMTIADLERLSPEQQQAGVEALFQEGNRIAFDYRHGPLFNALLLALSPAEHVLIITMPAMCADGQTLENLVREIGATYSVCLRGEMIADEPLQFADLAEWQIELLESEETRDGARFWHGRDISPQTRSIAPFERGHQDGHLFSVARLRAAVDPDLVPMIEALVETQGASTKTFLLACWQLLLWRLTGKQVTIGAEVDGRPYAELEDALGPFAKYVPVACQLEEECDFARFLREVEGREREACKWQVYFSWDRFDAANGTMAETSFFSLCFSFATQPEWSVAGGPCFSISRREVCIDRFKLKLDCLQAKKALITEFHYDACRFLADDIKRLADSFHVLVENAVKSPETPLSRLEMLSVAERRQLLVELNDTATEYHRERLCLHEQFEEQARRAADRVAATFQGQLLTYAHLNSRANQLARYLGARGAGPEVLVGVYLDRSLDLVVGLLGILKAGAAYVPLDPSYPSDMIAYLLKDAAVSLLLTQRDLASHLSQSSVELVCVGTDWPLIERESPENLRSTVLSENVAYVIYTSGSTGRPKGAMLPHRGIVNCLLWMQETYKLDSSDRFLFRTSLNFDPSVWEVFWTLSVGATVVMASGDLMEEALLVETVIRDGVTTIYLVPTMLEVFLSQTGARSCGSLKRVICGGESLSGETLRRYFSLLSAELHHSYGPTETSIAATEIKCAPGLFEKRVPIGRPIANTRAYVTDPWGQLVPLKISGELLIGGVCLGRGYLNRPDLTAERFIPSSFEAERGSRLYMTGDLVRILSGGNIEFLSRVDHQLKIHGHRIEPGEIESVLGQHHSVHQALAMVREDSPGEKRLVAYVVPWGEEPTADELRTFLKSRIPEHMIPSIFVALSAFPLMPTGKVDRKALPTPERTRAKKNVVAVPPRTETEKMLADIWAQVLRVREVGVHDNFFELGGDSILSIQIVARAREAGLSLTPKQLFDHQTIAELAWVAGTTTIPATDQGVVTGRVPLTPIQERFFEQELAEANHYNHAVMLKTREKLDVALLEKVIGKLMEQHDALRMRFKKEGGRCEQEIMGIGVRTPVVRVDLGEVRGEERRREIESVAGELQLGMDLREGRVMVVGLIEAGEEEGVRLLIIIHHLVVDGVSWRILLEDLERGYEQARTGEEIELPVKTTSYQEWAKWLREYAETDEVRKEVEYWEGNLEEEGIARLPVDYEGGENVAGRSGAVKVEMSEEETEELLGGVVEAYRMQINEVVLAAVVESVMEWTRGKRIRIEVEGHGREEMKEWHDLSRSVGWFTSMYPLEFERVVGGDEEMLKEVKERMRGVPKRGIGYGVLRYLSRDEETAKRMRSVAGGEVSFNYLGQLDRVLGGRMGFEASEESVGWSSSARNKRGHLVEISGMVRGGRLEVEWRYGEEVHRRESIESVARKFKETLSRLIEHSKEAGAGAYTASDFPMAGLGEEELRRALGGIDYQRKIEDMYPLSPLQEGLVFHSLSSPDSGYYVTQVLCTLSRLDLKGFRKAWKHLLDRHSVLRTAFVWKDLKRPLQAVCKHSELPLKEEDWRGLPAERRRRELETYLEADRLRGFELTRPPLMRLALFRVDDETYQFVWTHHHVLLDGWSTYLVIKELFHVYEKLCDGERPELEPSRPYRDYIAWLGRQDLREAERYWRGLLKGLTAPTSMVGIGEAAPRLAGRGRKYEERQIALTEKTTEALERLAREQRLTLNTVVQGAWAILLSWYSGEEDIVFGSVVSGRPPGLAGVETMVGMFINTLPMRVTVRPEVGLWSWLKSLQDQLVELRQYEYSPLVQIQKWSEIGGVLPLFETIYVFENYPVDGSIAEKSVRLDAGGFRVLERLNYQVSLVVKRAATLSMQITSDSGRLNQATIECAAQRLKSILEQFVTPVAGAAAGVEQPIHRLFFLTDAERHQVIREFNDTQADCDLGTALPSLFEKQCERAPDRIAQVFLDQHLTFKELNCRANRLAHYLRALGVGLESLVGVYIERSVEMVIAVMGILKAGAAYVPLDLEYPRERLAFMTKEANLAALLVRGEVATRLPANVSMRVRLDQDWRHIARQPDENQVSEATARNLAYVIYTSGSTGRPKGVMNTHEGICNRLVWMQSSYPLTETDAVAQKTPLGFDVSVWELFWPLLTGARLIIAPPGAHKDANQLTNLVNQYMVTTIHFVPSMLGVFLDNEGSRTCRSLRQVISSGETLSPALQERFFGRLDAALHNLYGPTEAAIDVTSWACSRDNKKVPIGRPIHNIQIHMMDRLWRQLPVGMPGELYIGGVGLARGYVNQPSLTAEKFLPDHVGKGRGTRLYKTGDLAGRLPDGSIEFLGRIDHQVKVRGVRVELDEIGAAIKEHPDVKEALVVLREDTDGDKRLTAYLVAAGHGKRGISQLREHVRRRLPEYLVPSFFVMLEAFPLTPNGKVDRRVLPRPGEADLSQLDQPHAAPRTRLERDIASVWRDVLKLEKLGIHDNFFDLGGHSLLMIQVHGKLQTLVKQEISMMDLLEHPTISALARFLGRERDPLFFSEDGDRIEKQREGKGRLRRRLEQRRRELSEPA